MPEKARKVIPVVVFLLLATLTLVYFLQSKAQKIETQTVSGYIEAVQIRLAPEVAGRVLNVLVEEGQSVKSGETLVKLDAALAEAQYQQAQAAAWAARSNAEAALANYSLLEAGASAEQLAVAQAAVESAQVNLDAAQETYDAVPEAQQNAAAGTAARQQLDRSQAALNVAQAQYDLTAAGPRPEQLQAVGAQSTAAAAQAAAAEAALLAAATQVERFTISAPMNAVVLERAVQPGEYVAPGGTLLVLADLSRLTLTIYVPEDRYGQIALGQTLYLTVDSFPNETFSGQVNYIADQAEFTPRNVQTVASRKTTVYAVRLTLNNPAGQLKPGMPASIRLDQPAD